MPEPGASQYLIGGDATWACPHPTPPASTPTRSTPTHASPCSYANVYRELEQTIRLSDAQEDLRWFRSSSGPGMPMNWPQFEVRLGTPAGVLAAPWGGWVLRDQLLCTCRSGTRT